MNPKTASKDAPKTPQELVAIGAARRAAADAAAAKASPAKVTKAPDAKPASKASCIAPDCRKLRSRKTNLLCATHQAAVDKAFKAAKVRWTNVNAMRELMGWPVAPKAGKTPTAKPKAATVISTRKPAPRPERAAHPRAQERMAALVAPTATVEEVTEGA